MNDKVKKFQNLSFNDFKQLAKDESLNCYEKIGFPTEYRQAKEMAIFSDIRTKLPLLEQRGLRVLEVGPGCSELALINLCEHNGHELILIDSQEMLDLLPNKPFIKKISGCFPQNLTDFLESYKNKIDIFLCYSVMHYIFFEGNWFDFLDQAVGLLNWGGQALLGDLPNHSMRQRFFNSPNGVAFHKAFTKTDTEPSVQWQPTVQATQIDDSVILASLMRVRAAGYHAYVVPQPQALPMANRREDILIYRP